jgi:DNA-binding transcriptional ArsR family regulator
MVCYNHIIMTDTIETSLSPLFDLLSQPARVKILLVIREDSACVCHLMAALDLRQASISQHLMALRKAGWVTTQREGRNIYYRLSEPRLGELIIKAAAIARLPAAELNAFARRPLPECPCPKCHPEFPPDYSCQSLITKKKAG